MKVLVLGGTGAMGKPLQKYLLEYGHEVHVTSRFKHEHSEIIYHCGDGHNISFLKEIVADGYDVIVDFMAYKTRELKERVDTILGSTQQYVFISSSRVYAPNNNFITEDSPRLLDICEDQEYLKTDEYALAKARQEDILKNSEGNNWTIVRPSLTYNSERLQYAIGEKEEWLYRYLNNKKIVFPGNMKNVITTMSYGDDVAHAISLLVGNKASLGETVHIAGARSVTWSEVNQIYESVLEERLNRKLEFVYVNDWEMTGKALGNYYQLKYARSISRRFDNSKLERLVGKIDFVDPEEGLAKCLNQFLDSGCIFKDINWKTEAYYNRITKDKNDEFSGKAKLKYIIGRFTPYFKFKY